MPLACVWQQRGRAGSWQSLNMSLCQGTEGLVW